MTVGIAPPELPTSTILSGWMRQLAPWRPRTVWLGNLFGHQCQATFPVGALRPLDRLDAILLLALESISSDGVSHGDLGNALDLPAATITALLRRLDSLGLAVHHHGGWLPTDAGRTARQCGQYLHPAPQPRRLFFAERVGADNFRIAPPHYLPLGDAQGKSWIPGAGFHFNSEMLNDAISRPASWKARMQFPSDILTIRQERSSWQDVIIVRPERHFVVIFESGNSDDATPLRAFAVPSETEPLDASRLLFALALPVLDDLPELFPRAESTAPSMVRLLRNVNS